MWNNYAIESYTKNIRSSLSQIKFAEFNNEFLDSESISKSLGSLNKLDKYITGRVSSRKVVPEFLNLNKVDKNHNDFQKYILKNSMI